MLGELQSGIQRGRAVDLENHWDLLDAATRFGRSFMQPPTEQDGTKADSSESQEGAATASNAIVKWLDERDVTAFYGKTNASSKQGLSLRIMMALFDERKNDESNTIEAINTLQNLDASKGELLQDDKTIHAKIVEAFFDDRNVIDLGTKSGMEKPVLPLKPYPTEKRLDLIDEDVLFVVLDCETTGLDDKTCHVIQLAGKVLGSDDENDLFSEYILPPNTSHKEEDEYGVFSVKTYALFTKKSVVLENDPKQILDFRNNALLIQVLHCICNTRARGPKFLFVVICRLIEELGRVAIFVAFRDGALVVSPLAVLYPRRPLGVPRRFMRVIFLCRFIAIVFAIIIIFSDTVIIVSSNSPLDSFRRHLWVLRGLRLRLASHFFGLIVDFRLACVDSRVRADTVH